MGKAIVISIALILLAISFSLTIRWYFKEANKVGDLNLKQEREMRHLIEGANRVLTNLGSAYAIEDTDVLSGRSQQAVNQWISDYETWTHNNQKEINA